MPDAPIQYPLRFRAAILERNKAPLVVDEVTFPGPLKRGQILVRVHYSGICGKQLEEIEGSSGPDPFLPHMLGHEGAGVVLAVGPDVVKAKADDRVVLHWMKGSGIDAETPWYERNGDRVNAGWVTTFNELAVVSENRITVVHRDADLRAACLLGCASSTGIGVIRNEARPRAGEAVVVVGCGGVGLNVVQAAALAASRPIIAIDPSPARRAAAVGFGATHALPADDDAIAAVMRLTNGVGAPTVIVTASSPKAIETGAECAATPGMVFVLGVPPRGARVTLDAVALHRRRTITGSFGGDISPDRDIPAYLGLHEEGRVRFNELIAREVSLDDINAGILLFRRDDVAGRIVVRMIDGDERA